MSRPEDISRFETVGHEPVFQPACTTAAMKFPATKGLQIQEGADLSTFDLLWVDHRFIINSGTALMRYPANEAHADEPLMDALYESGQRLGAICRVDQHLIAVPELAGPVSVICVHSGRKVIVSPPGFKARAVAFCPQTNASETRAGHLWMVGEDSVSRTHRKSSDCLGPGQWEQPESFALPEGMTGLGACADDKGDCHLLISRIVQQSGSDEFQVAPVLGSQLTKGASVAPHLQWWPARGQEVLQESWIGRLVFNTEGYWWIGLTGSGRYHYDSNTINLSHELGHCAAFETLNPATPIAVSHVIVSKRSHSLGMSAIAGFDLPRPRVIAWSGASLRRWNIEPARNFAAPGEKILYKPGENDPHPQDFHYDMGPICATPTGIATFFRIADRRLRWVFVDLQPSP